MQNNRTLKSLITINKKSLNDVLKLLEKINNELYNKNLSIIDDNSISMHFKHIYDFWNCFYQVRESGKFNYNDRQRNEVLEHDKFEMKNAFNSIFKKTDSILFEEITFVDDLIDSSNKMKIKSNTNRELVFLYEHTIHHIYIIRMVMNSLNIEVEDDYIGYNLSTIKNIECVS